MKSSLIVLVLGLCCTVSEVVRAGDDGTRTFKADKRYLVFPCPRGLGRVVPIFRRVAVHRPCTGHVAESTTAGQRLRPPSALLMILSWTVRSATASLLDGGSVQLSIGHDCDEEGPRRPALRTKPSPKPRTASPFTPDRDPGQATVNRARPCRDLFFPRASMVV